MDILTDIQKLENVLTKVLAEEWEAQGHKMTGAITDTIEYVVKQEATMLTLSGFMNFYGNILAAGTPANRIPFSGRSGRGGTSAYIAALQNYAKQRMNISGEKESLSVAFAIAHKQKKEGMPTKGSYKYSSTGKRLDWIEEAFKKNEDRISEVIRTMAYDTIKINLDVLLNRWQIELNKN